jgi:hypothetical protein
MEEGNSVAERSKPKLQRIAVLSHGVRINSESGFIWV